MKSEIETIENVSRPQSEVGKSKTKGHGQFDAKGNSLLPVKINGEIKLMPKSKVEKILSVTSKQLVDAKKKGSSRKNAKTPKGKVGDPKFERSNVVERDAWIRQAVKEFGLTVEHVKVNNEMFKTEPVLSYGNPPQRIIWASPRAGALWGVYEFTKSGKEIVRIHDQKEIDALSEWVKKRCSEIDSEPKSKPKAKVVGKKGATKKAPSASVIDRLNAAAIRATKAHGVGFSLKTIRVKNSAEVAAWAQSKGYTLHSNSISFQ